MNLCTRQGEFYHCSCLTVLPGPALVLLSYVLQTFIFGSVRTPLLRESPDPS